MPLGGVCAEARARLRRNDRVRRSRRRATLQPGALQDDGGAMEVRICPEARRAASEPLRLRNTAPTEACSRWQFSLEQGAAAWARMAGSTGRAAKRALVNPSASGGGS